MYYDYKIGKIVWQAWPWLDVDENMAGILPS